MHDQMCRVNPLDTEDTFNDRARFRDLEQMGAGTGAPALGPLVFPEGVECLLVEHAVGNGLPYKRVGWQQLARTGDDAKPGIGHRQGVAQHMLARIDQLLIASPLQQGALHACKPFGDVDQFAGCGGGYEPGIAAGLQNDYAIRKGSELRGENALILHAQRPPCRMVFDVSRAPRGIANEQHVFDARAQRAEQGPIRLFVRNDAREPSWRTIGDIAERATFHAIGDHK